MSSRWPLGIGDDRHGRSFAFEPRASASAPRNQASHDRIIDSAVGEFFTEEALSQIVDGTVEQDSVSHQGMSPTGTAAHSMRNPWDSPARAVQLRDEKIAAEKDEIRVLILAGKAQQARNKFGRVTHTVQDKYPRAHTAGADGRVPLPWNPGNIYRVIQHARSDGRERMGTDNVRAAIAETLAVFEAIEADVLGLGTMRPGVPFTPEDSKYDVFLKFRGIIVQSKQQRDPYLAWDRPRWSARKTPK